MADVGESWQNISKQTLNESNYFSIIGRELDLLLDDKANLIDAIKEMDRMIRSKESFPVPDYRSLLHMIYNPVENRFYNQVAITAYKESGQGAERKRLSQRKSLLKE